ncbi:Ribonuclease R [Escherichia coli]|uniref:Ribonuclease R n=1 Tax=Escherichia coli TaxID=562 RepID=A0A376TNX6_ECOLX|nr:Ribonuclease R [Escherichia coli]
MQAKKGGKRRQVGKKVNFEPDSAFRGEKKTKPKAAKKDARKAKKPSAKTQKNSRSDQSEACGEEKSGRVINTLFKRRGLDC